MGKFGNDYVLGFYFGSGNEIKGHGFQNHFNNQVEHFLNPMNQVCFVSNPPHFTNEGALVSPAHNWLQTTTLPIIVDLVFGNESEQDIVFASINHPTQKGYLL